MSNVECVFNGFYKGLHVLKIRKGLKHVKYAQQGVCMGKVKSEDIVYWRYRFTGRETDITKCILAIFR